MASLLAILFGLLLAIGAVTAPARAQTGESTGFLDPFPDGDRYRVQVWGDAMSSGLLEGLVELMATEARFVIDKKHRWLSGIMKTDAESEAAAIDGQLASTRPHIVVMMLGSADRVAWRPASGKRAGVGTDEWKEEYQRRLDLVMRALRKRSVAVFWVGLPIMRRDDVNEDAEMMNELFRSRALANGARYIDIHTSFADGDKAYTAHGPDVAGKPRLLREPDGVHFTWAGHRRLAYFVERELKRAAQQAWDERTIPLAGTEAEQSRIRPPATVKLAPLPAAPRAPGDAATATALGASALTATRPSAPSSERDADGIKAETGRITIRGLTSDGREEAINIEIPRPAIPASVVALITRRETDEKAANLGDTVMTEILGGLTVVSAVTPLAEATADRRRAGGPGSPMMRVLQRGETLPPKPGRADEMPWPRPEALASVEPPPVAPRTPEAAPARDQQPPAKRIRRPPPQQ